MGAGRHPQKETVLAPDHAVMLMRKVTWLKMHQLITVFWKDIKTQAFVRGGE